MIWVDWVILAIIGISALISLMRGFIREALSLAAWIAAYLLAKAFYEPVSVWLEPHIDTNSIRLGVAWGAIFVSVLVVTGIINHLIGKMVDKAGLSGIDRLLGMAFGALRGVLIVALIVLGLKQFTPIPKDKWWGESTLIPHMEMIAQWSYDKLGEVVPELKDEKPQSESDKKLDELKQEVIKKAISEQLDKPADEPEGSY